MAVVVLKAKKGGVGCGEKPIEPDSLFVRGSWPGLRVKLSSRQSHLGAQAHTKVDTVTWPCKQYGSHHVSWQAIVDALLTNMNKEREGE